MGCIRVVVIVFVFAFCFIFTSGFVYLIQADCIFDGCNCGKKKADSYVDCTRTSSIILPKLNPKLLESQTVQSFIFMNNSYISIIPNEPVFQSIHSKYMFFDGNNLKDLPLNIFQKIKYLFALSLKDNRIQTIDGRVFDPLKEFLIMLTIGGNRLLEIPYLKSLTKLRDLDLSLNKIQRLDKLKLPDSLEKLFLNDNQILQLEDDCLQELNKLKYLHLNRNQISSIGAYTFNRLKQLVYLDISENFIIHIETSWFSGFASNNNFGHINLSKQKTKIESIQEFVFDVNSSVEITFNENIVKYTDRKAFCNKKFKPNLKFRLMKSNFVNMSPCAFLNYNVFGVVQIYNLDTQNSFNVTCNCSTINYFYTKNISLTCKLRNSNEIINHETCVTESQQEQLSPTALCSQYYLNCLNDEVAVGGNNINKEHLETTENFYKFIKITLVVTVVIITLINTLLLIIQLIKLRRKKINVQDVCTESDGYYEIAS